MLRSSSRIKYCQERGHLNTDYNAHTVLLRAVLTKVHVSLSSFAVIRMALLV